MSFTLDNVTFRYSTPTGDKTALQSVSAELPAGKVIAVLGPSGCGKTTLLNLLALLWEGPIDSRKILYHDGAGSLDYHQLNQDSDQRARLRREQFGVILQNCYLLPHFNCLHNISWSLALQGWEEPDRLAWAEVLIKMADANGEQRESDIQADLWGARTQMPREVSLGQKQRIAVLRALAHNPRVVFADEPISNLDPSCTQAILQLLLDWQAGILHADGARQLSLSSPTSAVRLAPWLRAWQMPTPGCRTLILVCHHIDTAKKCADQALLFDENHVLRGSFFPDADQCWPELDAELPKVFHSKPLRKPPR